MTNSGTSEFTIVDGTNIYVDDAAQIWAEATAKRDGEPDVAPLGLSRPIIENALNSSRDPLLLVAIDRTDKPVGMALITPDNASRNHALLRYFAVSPSAWGLGVGKALIQETMTYLS